MEQLKYYHKYSYTCLLHAVKVSSHLEKLEKSFYISNFYDPEISASAENSMILTAPYSEVSLRMTNIFLSELIQYIRNMLKKFWMKMMLVLDFIVILKMTLCMFTWTMQA